MGVGERADGGAARDTNLAKLLPRELGVRCVFPKRRIQFTQAYPVKESECVSSDGIVGGVEGVELHALSVVRKARCKEIGQLEAMYAVKARTRYSKRSGDLKEIGQLRRSVSGKLCLSLRMSRGLFTLSSDRKFLAGSSLVFPYGGELR